ncbi:MAG: ABC transporter ATP-binding protein [Actinobacteria bacterium]|nr:ABC transporter ATP-binding protein [Actinomycetota bacterium]
MSSGPAISVRNVSKRYRLYHERNQTLKGTLLQRKRVEFEEFWALRDVSLEVPRGGTFGLIGENGSGKSTLLKCMARILNPNEGAITVNGKMSALLELGAGFHPELSGRENVFLNGSILGLSKRQIEERFDEIVDFAGLQHFIDTPVKNYSSGMYVRLGFSVAINVDPEVLLVDEVLAVGDEQFQRKCAEKFAELKESGKTIVIVSHALGSVRTLCDEVALLEHGRLRVIGPPGQVIDTYLGDVHTDRAPDGELGTRWGSGEARIEHIELLDAAGSATTEVQTGEPVTFRFHWEARQPIQKPVFGLALYTLEGVQVTGPNTRQADMVPDTISGSGTVDLRVDRLLLLPGTYDLTASLLDFTCSHAYDNRHRAFRFDVRRGEPQEEQGIVSLGGTWAHDRNGGPGQ